MSTPLSNLSATWNNVATTFTAIRMAVTDTASAAGSKVMDLIVGSTSMFQVRKDGHTAIGADSTIDDPWPSVVSIVEQSHNAGSDFSTALNVYGYWHTAADNDSSYEGFSATVELPSGSDFNYSFGPIAMGGGVNVNFNGTAQNVWACYNQNNHNSGHVVNSFQYYAFVAVLGGTVDNVFHYWGHDLSGAAYGTNNYFLWYDGPGVVRIKEENGTKGAVYAWYNPTFTKYTPGAVNFERGVLQYNANVLEIGAEAGGTGVLRMLRLLGNIPTSDPHVVGVLWNSSGTMKISAG